MQLNPVLFASAAGPKIVQALGGGSVEPELRQLHRGAARHGRRARSRCASSPSRPIRRACSRSSRAPEFDSVPKLAGKKVACTAGTGLHYYLARILSKFGMTQKDIEFVNLPAADGQAAFVAGRVDADRAVGQWPLLHHEHAQGYARALHVRRLHASRPASTQPFLNYDLFVTTESVLQSQRRDAAGDSSRRTTTRACRTC